MKKSFLNMKKLSQKQIEQILKKIENMVSIPSSIQTDMGGDFLFWFEKKAEKFAEKIFSEFSEAGYSCQIRKCEKEWSSAYCREVSIPGSLTIENLFEVDDENQTTNDIRVIDDSSESEKRTSIAWNFQRKSGETFQIFGNSIFKFLNFYDDAKEIKREMNRRFHRLDDKIDYVSTILHSIFSPEESQIRFLGFDEVEI